MCTFALQKKRVFFISALEKMPTSGVQTNGLPVPTASSNVRRDSGRVTNAALLAETMGTGQDIWLAVKVDYGHVMIFAYIHAYVYTREYMCTCVSMPGYMCTSVYAMCQCVSTLFVSPRLLCVHANIRVLTLSCLSYCCVTLVYFTQIRHHAFRQYAARVHGLSGGGENNC